MFGINCNSSLPTYTGYASFTAGPKVDVKQLSKVLQGFKNKDKVLSFIIAINADDQATILQLRPAYAAIDRDHNYIYLCFNPQSHCIIRYYIAMYLENMEVNYQDGNCFIYG